MKIYLSCNFSCFSLDIIKIELLCYNSVTLIERVRFHTCKFGALSFELKLTSDYNLLFLTNSFTVVIDFEFQHELHLLFQFYSKDKVQERKVQFVPTSITRAIYFETYSTQIQCNEN